MPDLDTLNPQQRDAVETIRGPVLILAGAGTGKTRVITFRIAHMVDCGVNPANILGVTFTNKAAREMKERVGKLIPRLRAKDRDGRKAEGPTVSTFHSLCARILREHIEVLGYKRNFVIYDESEQLGAIKKILSQISAKGEKTDPKAILTLLSKFKNGGAQAAAFADPSVRALAEHVQRRYDSALHACNAIDFDDLLLLALRLFEEHPDVLDACRKRYRYVMVDEYQDTNAAQFRLVNLLCQQHRNLCVVGDDDQSIYGWRGAEIANLLDLEKHYGEVRVIKLEQNYRSTSTILKAANAVIRNNARRRGKQLWSQKGDGAPIALHAFETDEDEARTIVQEIEFQRVAKRVPWGQQAILFRTNLQARPIEMALRQGNVRYHLIGGQSYFDRREVRDLLAFLKTFLNPHDDVSLLRIANVPARGLSDVTMERLLAASQERHSSVFAAMRHTDVLASFQARTRESIQEFVAFVERVHAQLQPGGLDHLPPAPVPEPAASEPAAAASPEAPAAPAGPPRPAGPLRRWAERWLDEIGYLGDLRRSEKDPQTAENRVRNLQELLADMDGSDPRQSVSARLEEFLEDLALDSEREEDADEKVGDAVTLITMHSCKGLEYPHVYVVGIEDGLLPHSRSKVEGTLDEERRLFYVAITRAMQKLTLSHCAGRKKYGQVMPCHPSPFLKEIPADLIEDANAKGKQQVAPDEGSQFFAALRQAIQ